MIELLQLLPEYLSGHINLALASLGVGVLISIPLGILAARYRTIERAALTFAGIVQTIPGLALLAIMVPLLAYLNLTSIGYLPAFIALVLYSILPILRNTVVGLKAVDPASIEAAKGLGMTRLQRLFQVELPLATPMIIAGIRTSTTWTIGMATLSTPIGATSLGNYIFVGLQTQNVASIVIGCVAAALLALFLDGLVRMLAVGIERSRKGMIASALLTFGLMFSYVAYDLAKEYWPTKSAVVVGAKAFTEQYILTEIIGQKFQSEIGVPTKVRQSLSSMTAYKALKASDIHVFVEYAATLWSYTMQRNDAPRNSEDFYRQIQEFLAKDGITLVGQMGFNNQYGLAIKRSLSNELGIHTMSDLAKHTHLILAADYEFLGRPEWKSYQDVYHLQFKKIVPMDHALMYQAADNFNVDVLVAFTTDGYLQSHDMIVLTDDKQAALPFDAILLANDTLFTRFPDAAKVLEGLTNSLSNEQMTALNFKVDGEGKVPATVAREYVEST